MGEIRIGIVDDHAVVRQGLQALLDREPDMRVVGHAGSVASALTMTASTRPDVVVLDLKLSPAADCEGLGLCGKLAGRFPALRILVLTTFADEWLIVQAIRQGAAGYVVKDIDLTDLLRAIRVVSRGGSAFDEHSANAVVRWLHTSGDDRTSGEITTREHEILAMLAQGLSNAAIGQRLFISSATVKFHVANLLQKLGTKRRAEAVYAAAKMGLI
jgi:two-component system, NarL family, response regulator DevR